MSEYRDGPEFNNTSYLIPVSMLILVGLQIYLSDFLYTISIKDEPQWVLGIAIAIGILLFGMTFAMSAVWGVVTNSQITTKIFARSNLIVVAFIYSFLSVGGYFIVSLFQKEHEDGHPYLIYAGSVILVFVIGLWRTIKLLNNRIKEVDGETFRVMEYIHGQIDRIKNEKTTYGFAFQMLEERKYKERYYLLCLRELKNEYVSLSDEEMVKDLDRFLTYKRNYGIQIKESTIYFPTSHSKPRKRLKESSTVKPLELNAKALLKGAILHERMRTEPLKQTGENKGDNP